MQPEPVGDRLVQIRRHEGVIRRVPRGEVPIIELGLDANTRVLSADLCVHPSSMTSSGLDRKTVDWRYTVYTSWEAPYVVV